jgi:tellurium resistance protein TerZ
MSINLSKGQKVSLKKDDGQAITSILLGLGWDVGSQRIDLDGSCATFDQNGSLLESIYYGNKKSKNGAIKHSGDNLTGAGAGDDEQILVDLNSLPAAVQNVVLTVTSYSGQRFTSVKNAYVRIVNRNDSQELCRYNLTEKYDTTGIILARLYRHNGEWKVAAIGEPANGKTISALVPAIKAILG